MYRVAAYITAYEDIDAVKRCVNAIQKQSYPIEKIYIIDNSYNLLNERIDNQTNLIIEHHPENIGIAQGLNISISWAISNNYDFLWTFDQDSEPVSNALNSLIKTYEKLKDRNLNPGIIACLPIDRATGCILNGLKFNQYKFSEITPDLQFNDYYECDIAITSGSLVILEAAKNVFSINEDLFIDAVDWDFCLKLKKCGYTIYIDKNSILNHQYGNSYKIKTPFYNRELTISNYSPLRYYYICRNHTFIETRYALINEQLTLSVIHRILILIKKIIKIILYDKNNRVLKIFACLRGTYDGFTGKLGKYRVK